MLLNTADRQPKCAVYGDMLAIRVVSDDGSTLERPSGTGFFGCAGIRSFSQDVFPIAGVGSDYASCFGSWLKTRGIPTAGLIVRSDRCVHNVIYEAEKGGTRRSLFGEVYSKQNVASQKIFLCHSERYLKGVTHLLLCDWLDRVNFEVLMAYRGKMGFQVMWCIPPVADEVERSNASVFMRHMDFLALSHPTGALLFQEEDDSKIIRILTKMEAPVFYLGKNGDACLIQPNDRVVVRNSALPPRLPVGIPVEELASAAAAGVMWAFGAGYDSTQALELGVKALKTAIDEYKLFGMAAKIDLNIIPPAKLEQQSG